MMRAHERWRRRWDGLHTIRWQLTLWYVLLLALALLMFSTFLYVSLSRRLYRELDHRLQIEHRLVIAESDLDEDPPRLDHNLPDGAVVALYDPTGTRLIDRTDQPVLPLSSEILAQVRQGHEVFATVPRGDGTPWRVLTMSVLEDGHHGGVLQIARSRRDINVALEQLMALMLVAIPVLLLLAIGGGLFLAGRALGPIDRITRTAARIGANDLSQRLNLPGRSDEVGRLAATFDHMLDRLERAFQRQRQFTADASHELRTPLALVISQADVALERCRSAEEYRQVIGNMREDAARMDQLLGELLTLARADAGRQALTLEPLALNEVVNGVVEAMAPLAEARGVRLAHQTSGASVVDGDQTRLTQLVVNLIDNGLKYTPSGGMVTVAVERTGSWVDLRVTDTGVGIPAEHLPQVFERFYRVDTARARSAGGAGLGLAICQWIAHAHGGDISVTSQLGHGTTFTVRLPLANRRTLRGAAGAPPREMSRV